MKFIPLSAALIAIAACAAGAHDYGASHETRNAPVECRIVAVPTSHGLSFQAEARSLDGVSGEYEFTLTKHGRSGSSDIMQSGEFDLAPGAEDRLGLAEIGFEGRPHYQARLTLSDANGEICSDELSS